jgi:chitinase
VKLFIAGDLPVQDGRGGAGSAKGVFDGIDIDWEYPGGGGQPYNTADAVNDKHNFTLLMQEFRAQLDAQGATDGKRYLLTAIGAGTEKIAQTEPALYSQYMDWVNLMTYDFHGGWETTTNFHAPLYHDPADPSTGVLAKYNTNDAITALVAAGMPKNKILLGVPFYGRGWKGVAAGPNANGLYQSTTGPAAGTYEGASMTTRSWSTSPVRAGTTPSPNNCSCTLARENGGATMIRLSSRPRCSTCAIKACAAPSPGSSMATPAAL